MSKITDPIMHPYFIGKDTHCYTVYEIVTPTKKVFRNKEVKGDNYEKPQGHYSSFGAALQKIVTSKLHNEKDHYSSIKEYIERWEKLELELKKLQKNKK